MELSIDRLRNAVDEKNRASELALRYAALILTEFKTLSPEGRNLMAEILIALIVSHGETPKTIH